MTTTYTINHSISSVLETWLTQQTGFTSLTFEENGNKVVVVFTHANESARLTFEDNFASQIGLSGQNVNVSDTEILTNVAITPPALTGDVNNYNPTGLETASVIRIDGNTGSYNITGLAGGVDGRVITLVCLNAPFSLLLEDTSSTAANRFSFESQDGIWAPNPKESIVLRYDGNSSRWMGVSNSLPFKSIFGYHLAGDSTWALGTTAGTRIGESTSDKLGFYNKTPIVQPSANADTSGATLGQLETEVNELKQLLRDIGLLAP